MSKPFNYLIPVFISFPDGVTIKFQSRLQIKNSLNHRKLIEKVARHAAGFENSKMSHFVNN